MSGDLEILGDRYRLVRRLGRGSSCDVFEAHDLALGSTVALKRFRENSLDALVRIKSEFRTLADIDAPGLVRFFDLMVTGDAAFFTMELVDGAPLTDYCRGASAEQLRAVFGRVARAIGELHVRGQLHRDVKPGNILVTSDGTVRVLDFGLASATGPVSGTLAYMAPELFDGRAASAASDWYSFGVVLYEVLAGRVPASGHVAELVLRKKQRRFPAAREINAEAPRELSDLAWGLLDPDPTTRLGHDAIAARLSLGPADDVPVSRPRAALFGRARELAELDAALAGAIEGRPTVVAIEGDSGMGKSALVRSFVAGERASRCFVLKSAARPQESVPLRALDAMVDELAQVIARLAPGERAALEEFLPRSLIRAFPVLGMLGGGAPRDDLPGSDGGEVRREAQLAFAGLLRQLAALRPVILWIDDLQWADYESLLFLEVAIAGAGSARLLVVLSRRSSALPWPDREAWLAGFARIALAPLDDAAAQAILDAHTHALPMSDSVTARAMREAAGNAFLLEFLARHTPRDRARAQLVEMNSALYNALDALDPDARLLFECVVLVQHPVPVAYLGRMLADRSRLRGHAAQLSSAGLWSIDERDCARPYHDTLRERADAALDAEARRERHAALAVAFDEAGAPIEWQIPHLEGSGQRDEAARASIAAGRAAAERYAFEIAAAYFARALDLTELAPETRADVLEALSDNLAAAGNGRAAAESYTEAAEVFRATSESHAALAMRHKAAIALLRSGDVEAGRGALRAALRGLGERLPRTARFASIYEAIRLAIASRMPARKQPEPRVEMRLDTLWTSATTLSLYDPFAANALTLRFVRRAFAAGLPRWVVRAIALEAAFLSALGGRFRRRADRMMAELRTRAALARPYEQAWAAATEGSTAWLAGDIRRCYDWMSRARELFRGIPETGAYEFVLLDAFRLPAMALLGHHAAALTSAGDVLALARTRGDRFSTLPCLHGHITLAYLGAGQPERAAAAVDEARAIAQHSSSASSTSSPVPAYHQVWSRATLALYGGRGEDAHRLIAGAWCALRRSGMLRLEAVAGDLRYLRARCALAAARSLSGRARARRVRDATAQSHWLRRSALALGAATADAIDAQIAALDGRDSDVRSLASAASTALRGLGLVPDADALDRWSTGAPLEPIDQLYVG